MVEEQMGMCRELQVVARLKSNGEYSMTSVRKIGLIGVRKQDK